MGDQLHIQIRLSSAAGDRWLIGNCFARCRPINMLSICLRIVLHISNWKMLIKLQTMMRFLGFVSLRTGDQLLHMIDRLQMFPFSCHTVRSDVHRNVLTVYRWRLKTTGFSHDCVLSCKYCTCFDAVWIWSVPLNWTRFILDLQHVEMLIGFPIQSSIISCNHSDQWQCLWEHFRLQYSWKQMKILAF